MSVANTALVFNLAMNGYFVNDDMVAGPASVQGTASRLLGQCNRVVSAVLNGSFILPSILSGEAAWMVFVINDSLNAIKVFCAVGENLGGVLNSSLAIPAGQSGIFIPVPNSHGGTNDWRNAVIP